MPTRSPLTRECIIDAALGLADEQGLDALSMRAIAARLGVQAMSLYNHVPNKASILDGLHERLMLSQELDVERLSWEDALRRVAYAMRRVALAHPKVFVLLATRPVSTANEMTQGARVFAAVARGGFDPDQCLFVVNLFVTSLSGLLLAEVAPVPGHPDVAEPDSLAALGTVGPDETEFAGVMRGLVARGEAESYFADRFDAFVDVLIAGLRTLQKPGPTAG